MLLNAVVAVGWKLADCVTELAAEVDERRLAAVQHSSSEWLYQYIAGRRERGEVCCRFERGGRCPQCSDRTDRDRGLDDDLIGIHRQRMSLVRVRRTPIHERRCNRRHSDRSEVKQVTLVTVPLQYLTRIDHPCDRGDAANPTQKLYVSFGVVPRAADDDKWHRFPRGRVVPGRNHDVDRLLFQCGNEEMNLGVGPTHMSAGNQDDVGPARVSHPASATTSSRVDGIAAVRSGKRGQSGQPCRSGRVITARSPPGALSSSAMSPP